MDPRLRGGDAVGFTGSTQTRHSREACPRESGERESRVFTQTPEAPLAGSAYRNCGAYRKPGSWKNKPIELKALFSDKCIKTEANKHMPGNLKSFRGLQLFQPRIFEFSNGMRFWGGFATEGENEAKRSQCDKLFVIR